MKTVPARLVDSWDAVENGEPGTFKYLANQDNEPEKCLMAKCPCGCGEKFAISIYKAGEPVHGWLWDGNKEAPTLRPSIHRLFNCGWHGFLTAGVWESC